MLNRRELLATSVALTLAARARGTAAAQASERPVAQPGHFVAATALVEARAAAQAAAAGGSRVVWLGRDVTPVYTWLDTALRRAPFAVAGLTTERDLFVLERLAWDRGLRTVHREAAAGNGHAAIVSWRLDPRNFVPDTKLARMVSDTNLKVSDTNLDTSF